MGVRMVTFLENPRGGRPARTSSFCLSFLVINTYSKLLVRF
jgi:hypothetical protein